MVHPDGYIEVRDRIKDVIISGGENISSVEVEALLLRHDAVREAAVVGMPHEKWGEAPHAFIVFRQGQSASPEALRAFCRERIAHFKVPHSFTPSQHSTNLDFPVAREDEAHRNLPRRAR